MEALKNRIPGAVKQVAERIEAAGGRAVLVGGAVIDLIQEREPKDWDLEVYRLSYRELEEIFSDTPTKAVGQAFGTLKVFPTEDLEIDLSVPRVDNKVGMGHRDFEATLDPRMSPREAARRRDFTINTLGYDFLGGELVDEWGGLADLKAGVLRATDPDLFAEDPLRALRAMQLLPRKARSVDPGTLRLIQGMVDQFQHLAKERIYEEFRKLLLKADKPSIGLEFLRESGWIVHFPELVALIDCPQKEKWHPEGDVWTHSLLAADAAAQVRHLIPEDQREAFVFGVLLHDVGKPATTVLPAQIAAGEYPEERLYSAYGHDTVGEGVAEGFLRRMTDNKKMIKLTRAIVRQHMQPYALYSGNAGKGAYARLSRRMQEAGGDLHLIGRMCQCDACALGPTWKTNSLAGGTPNWEDRFSERVMDYHVKFEDDPSTVAPLVLGRDLLAAGLSPGPDVGKRVARALELQYSDAGLSKQDLIARVLSED